MNVMTRQEFLHSILTSAPFRWLGWVALGAASYCLVMFLWKARMALGCILVVFLALGLVFWLRRRMPVSSRTREVWDYRDRLGSEYMSFGLKSFAPVGLGMLLGHTYRAISRDIFDFNDFIVPVCFLVLGAVAWIIWKLKGIPDKPPTFTTDPHE